MSRFKPNQILILKELKHHLQVAKVRKELERDVVMRQLAGMNNQQEIPGEFFFIGNDLKYLVKEKIDDVSRPELTTLAQSMSFEDKVDNLIGLIEHCIDGTEFNSEQMRLFYRSVYRIKFNGSYVNVTEVIKNSYGLTVYQSDDEACYYAVYLVPKGVAEYTEVYQFSNEESNAFLQDRLDVDEIYKRLIKYGKILSVTY